MAFIKGLAIAVVAFAIFDAALFNGAYLHQIRLVLAHVAHLDWN